MIHDDIARACNTLSNAKIDAEAVKEAAIRFGEGMKVAAQGFAVSMRAIVDVAAALAPYTKRLLEHQRVMNAATPCEKRMMSHGRKRIRKKYYNRVKRRLEANNVSTNHHNRRP